MSEDDPTKDLTPNDAPTAEPSFEQRIMARFDALGAQMSALDERLTALETTVSERLKDTRPIWQAVEARLERIEDKLDVLNDHMLTAQADVLALKRRATDLEANRPQ